MQNKKLIVFDLDGTLAQSKSPMDKEMSDLLNELLSIKKVAVISGGSYNQYQNQFLKSLQCPEQLLQNLYLFPTCSTSFYRYDNGWKQIYANYLADSEKNKIMDAFQKAWIDINYQQPAQLYGDVLEDRLTQITFSALGQKAPLNFKKAWDPDKIKRMQLKQTLEKYIPEFDIGIGGTTSLDVTRKGIDKGYGIKQIEKHLDVKIEEMLFIGDALFEGGNDYPVKLIGVDCIAVDGPEETKKIIEQIIKK